jgi:membrane protein
MPKPERNDLDVSGPTTQPKRGRLGVAWYLGNETWDEFSKARGDLLAAALAFHTLLSMAPLIIVAVAVAGLILGQRAAHAEITRVLTDTIGAESAATVNAWVLQASEGGEVASAIGIVLTLFAASRFGEHLKNALNQIWLIDVQFAEGFKANIKNYLRRRIFAFGMVAAAGPLLLVVFASRTLLTGFHAALFSGSPLQGVAVQVLQIFISLIVVAGTSAAVFRYVPDTRVGWKNVLVGGTLTSVLFNIGNALVGLYLARASVTAAYGAAGSLVVVLLWLYFSAQMFLLGAEFTRVFTEHYGANLRPEEVIELEQVKTQAAHERESAPHPQR